MLPTHKRGAGPCKSGLGSFGMLSDKNQEVVQMIVIDDASLVRDANMPAFREAFACKEGDAMERPEILRARIW